MRFFSKKDNRSLAAKEIIREEKKAANALKFILIAAFIVILAAAIFYFLFFFPGLRVKEIRISGNKIIETRQIGDLADSFLAGKVWGLIPSRQMAAVSVPEISQKIKDEFPEIEQAKIKRILPDVLEIQITEKKPYSVCCESEIAGRLLAEDSAAGETGTSTAPAFKEEIPVAGNCFLSDENGILYRRSSEISTDLLPKFFLKAGENYGLKQEAVSSSTIVFAREFKEKMENSNVEIAGFSLRGENNREMAAYAEQGWVVYLDLSRPVETQTRVIETLLANELKGKRQNIEYIDLRIPNRAYYK